MDAIPPALEGRDIPSCAMTGSDGHGGRSCCPLIHRRSTRPAANTRALVLTPTRELAAQILASTRDLAVQYAYHRGRGHRCGHGPRRNMCSQRGRRHHRRQSAAHEHTPVLRQTQHPEYRARRGGSHARHGVPA
ncbi:MAG: DEAD/DEAH box helicase, partial [Acidobacteria bacterium]|nr:DEAD/DEAH box helicase [Acidobacteriota bacterium]